MTSSEVKTAESVAGVPYEVDPVDERRVVIRFAPICDQDRTKEHEDTLQDLVERYVAIACDFSQNTLISSLWLRWLARLSSLARQTGKIFALAGMNQTGRETADVLGLGKAFTHTRNVEEVWELK